jgi:hypothetical protein
MFGVLSNYFSIECKSVGNSDGLCQFSMDVDIIEKKGMLKGGGWRERVVLVQ